MIIRFKVLREGRCNFCFWDNRNLFLNNIHTRTQIVLNRPDVPTNSRAKSQPDSTTNQYIDFTHTDIDADAAQTTVPYVDAQDVTSIPPCAISGNFFSFLTLKK